MLTKLATIAFVTVASINCQALFLSDSAKSASTKVYQSIAQVDGPLKFELHYKCQYMAGLNFYDLKPLGENQDHYSYSDGKGSTIYISFCNNLPASALITAGCDSTKSAMSVLADSTGCHILTGSDPTADTSFQVLNTDDDNGLVITYKNGDPNYGLVLDMTCDGGQVFNETQLDTSNYSSINLKVNS